jgi:hypothetical protein
MSDHLTLKKIKELLPPDASGRIAAADATHKLLGVDLVRKLTGNAYSSRLHDWHTLEYFTESKQVHAKAHSLVDQDEEDREIRVGQRCVSGGGKGKLSQFKGIHVRSVDFGGTSEPIFVELWVPKASLHLVGPFTAEANHIYAARYDAWVKSDAVRRNRIRNVRRFKALRKLCRVIPRKHLRIDHGTPEAKSSRLELIDYNRAELKTDNRNWDSIPLNGFELSPHGRTEISLCLRLSKLRDRRLYRKILAAIAEERAWEKGGTP